MAMSPRIVLNTLAGTLNPIAQANKKQIVIKDEEIHAWMIGHASVLINFYGTTILTDPVFVNWLPLPKRRIAAGYTAAELPRLDLVLISHAHMDHFNRRSLRKLAPQSSIIIVPRNCGDLVPDGAFKKIIELNSEDEQHFDTLQIHAFRPIHWGERYPWQRKQRGYNSYLLHKNGRSIFFCGDSAYGDLFKSIGQQHRPDLALLPIGAYTPHPLRRVHMDPHDALRAFGDLGADHLIPIHWGNFRLSLERLEEPPQLLCDLASQNGWRDRVHLLRNGESIAFS